MTRGVSCFLSSTMIKQASGHRALNDSRVSGCAMGILARELRSVEQTLDFLPCALQFLASRLSEAAGVAVSCLRRLVRFGASALCEDRKSTRLNSSHSQISYAVFCLKK